MIKILSKNETIELIKQTIHPTIHKINYNNEYLERKVMLLEQEITAMRTELDALIHSHSENAKSSNDKS